MPVQIDGAKPVPEEVFQNRQQRRHNDAQDDGNNAATRTFPKRAGRLFVLIWMKTSIINSILIVGKNRLDYWRCTSRSG